MLKIDDPRAAYELAQGGSDAVRAVGRAYLAGWQGRVPMELVLRSFHDPDSIEGLAELARSDDGQLAAAAIGALGHSGQPEALAPLRALLAPDTCLDVARALGELGLPDGAPPLARLLDNDQLGDWDRAAVAAALARIGAIGAEAAERVLIRSIGSADIAAAVEATRALAWCATTPAVTALVQAAASDLVEIADEAVVALGLWGLPAVVPILLAVSERRPMHTHRVRRMLASMAGDALPINASHARMVAWWDRDRHLYPLDRHIWWGGRDRVHAISLLPTPHGGIARDCLEMWTGIDFVDNDARYAEGNEYDRDRAMAWSLDAPGWRDGAVYRRGIEVDVAPILDGLAAAG